MSGGTWYEMDKNNWFFLPNDGGQGHVFYCDEPEELVPDPERDGIDWSAALDAYFKDKGM